MNVFAVPDLIRAVANLLPDIRILRLNRELNATICEHPEYALWQKCAAAGSIYSHGTIKMLDNHKPNWDEIAYAVKYNNMQILDYLVKLGIAKPQLCELAAEYGQVHLVEKYTNYDIPTIIKIAIKYGQMNVVEWAMKQKEFIWFNSNDSTHLAYLACLYKRADMVRFWLDNGAQLSVDGADVTVEQNNYEIAKIFLDYGYSSANMFELATKYGRKDIAKLALEYNANIRGKQT